MTKKEAIEKFKKKYKCTWHFCHDENFKKKYEKNYVRHYNLDVIFITWGANCISVYVNLDIKNPNFLKFQNDILSEYWVGASCSFQMLEDLMKIIRTYYLEDNNE